MNSANPIHIPALPGLYIVTVECDEQISVNASDLRIADKCITINRHNCKFGRAKNLRARCRSYYKTFSPHPVTFRVIAFLKDINTAEAVCGKQLQRWRVRGRTGRSNEWMADITPTEVEAIVIQALSLDEFEFQRPELQPAEPSST